jgi:hypothetical protein
LSQIQAGVLELGQWSVSQASVDAYLSATHDGLNIYKKSQTVPPLALAAWALGAMLQKLNLPPGAIHGGQEVQSYRAIQIEEEVRCSAKIAQPTQRGTYQFLTVQFEITGTAGDTALTGKTTVILPITH